MASLSAKKSNGEVTRGSRFKLDPRVVTLMEMKRYPNDFFGIVMKIEKACGNVILMKKNSRRSGNKSVQQPQR